MSNIAIADSLFHLRPRTADERFGWAITFAVAVHAAAILGVTFAVPRMPKPLPTLEVTLTQFKEEAPKRADFIAPTNQLGSGDAASIHEMTATQSSVFGADREQNVLTGTPTPAQLVPVKPVEELTAPTKDATPSAPQVDDLVEPTPLGPQATRPLDLDAAHEVATLQARIDSASQWQARGPRVRRITSVSTQSTAEAYYLNAWRRHVETIGNVNYPSAARKLRIYGSLRMLVSIAADGSLQDVRVLESSGFPALDEGALNIVRLAAPFPPFSAEMRKSTDVLELIRTWQFKRVLAGEGFSTGN